MSDKTSELLEKYLIKKSAFKRADAGVDEQLQSYMMAASVLHVFNPDTLQPVRAELKHTRPYSLLLDHIIYVYGDSKNPRYTLRPAERRDTLKKFSSAEEKGRALAANPDREMTPLQLMWEQYLITGYIPDIRKMGYEDLICLDQMLLWITDSSPLLPSREEISKLISKRSVLSAFEHLVVANFTGRIQELNFLRRHVNSRSMHEKGIVDTVTGWFNASIPNPVLSVYGVGGIGKSALVGSLLKEMALGENNMRSSFAYLAFDQPTLRIESTYTIIVEIVSQLRLQFEDSKLFDEFDKEVRGFRSTSGSISESKESFGSRVARINRFRESEEELYKSFISLVSGLNKITTQQSYRSIVIVFDTFEEVQYRDRQRLRGFWQMLQFISTNVPWIRVIITGRSPINMADVPKDLITELRLEELNLDDRILLLKRLKITEPEIARAVAQQVGGNPLSLHLAANLVASDKSAAGTKGIKDLNTRKWLLFQLDENLIQGQLYQRIIKHMHSEEAKKLAHPGMVLRKITPEIILKVVAPVCNIDVPDAKKAKELFDELKREQALVSVESDEVLIYRPEIRTSMIKLLKQDKVEELRKLHEAAIRYYHTQPEDDEEARGEEMYHRLMLNESNTHELDLLWRDGMERFVVQNLDEYPDRMKVWLASRTSIELPRKIFENADIGEWERDVTRKVKQALQYNHVSDALALMKERDKRSDDSPLFALEAKADILNEDLTAAHKVLDKGIEQVTGSSNRGRLAELFWLKAQVYILQNDYVNADQLLSQAETTMEGDEDPHALMHILCHRIILRIDNNVDKQNSYDLKLKLSETLKKTDRNRYYDQEFVVNVAMNVLGEDFPISRSGFPFHEFQKTEMINMLTTENLRGLEKFRADWEEGRDNQMYEALV